MLPSETCCVNGVTQFLSHDAALLSFRGKDPDIVTPDQVIDIRLVWIERLWEWKAEASNGPGSDQCFVYGLKEGVENRWRLHSPLPASSSERERLRRACRRERDVSKVATELLHNGVNGTQSKSATN